jgi:hypothetical protein
LKFRGRLTKAEWVLIALFSITLPFVRAQIRQDGISYYGVTRSLVVDHNLQFNGDWKDRLGPSVPSRDRQGRTVMLQVSKTGHIPVHSPIGASLLWMPFIAATHGLILAMDHFGADIHADGFSEPYLVTMAGATCLFAFLGLWLSFRLARRYVDEQWAFLSTVALWLATSLPAYLYVDPAWSHAHSVFVVALFLWYWNRTRASRTTPQWFVLGLVFGLMAEVYFPNAAFGFLLIVELVSTKHILADEHRSLFGVARNYAVCVFAAFVAFIPTFVIRTILLGSPFAAGAYGAQTWNWESPEYLKVLLSPSQGLLTTTPIVIAALIGLFLLPRRDKVLGRGLITSSVAFCTIIAMYPFWNLGPAFGNRYCISLIPAFIPALAVLLDDLAHLHRDAAAIARRAWVVAGLLMVWNLGLVFQWSAGLMPDVGRVYWSEVLYNQFRIVPNEALRAVRSRFSINGEGHDGARAANAPTR